MNQSFTNNSFNCTYGCQNANDCQYYDDMNNLPAQPVASAFIENGNYYNETNNLNSNQYAYSGDSVVPVSNYDNQQITTNYSQQNFTPQNSAPYEYYVADPNMNGSSTTYPGYFIDNIPTYPPCQGPQPWNYAQCYGYYGEPPCQFANVVDMEDFMWVGSKNIVIYQFHMEPFDGVFASSSVSITLDGCYQITWDSTHIFR